MELTYPQFCFIINCTIIIILYNKNMVRIKDNAKVTGECIFCQKEKGKFDLLFIPPLGENLHVVCNRCLKVLESYQEKYPHLWDVSHFM